MPMVALFAAEGAEAQALLKQLSFQEAVDGPWNIYQGELGRYPVVLIETGVGKAAAAAAVAYGRVRSNP